MDINNPPRSFGVFKPVDHTVVTFANPAAMESAVDALLAQGFFAEDLTRYSAAQMLARSESDLPLGVHGSGVEPGQGVP